MSASLRGVLPVDKPEGPTSHDVVAAARRALGTRRIGHTGTLDPFASGLLLLCVGQATRIAEYLTDLPKTYRATMRLGVATDTADRTGAPVSESAAWRELSRDRIAAALASQVGRIRQLPPAYSAKKVAGERAYDRARRGEAVRLEPAEVEIYRLDVLAWDLPDITFEVVCSSGTYIRAIARDVGEALGVGGHLVALRRTRIGRHDVDRAVPVERLTDAAAVRAAWMSPLAALGHLPRVDVDAAGASALRHGRALPLRRGDRPAHTPIAVAHGGALLAIGEFDDERLRPRKVFQ
ncbi:MAG TPA: tRNA pseudouridine(55) synthase TruB [Longimicrobiales bacterium]